MSRISYLVYVPWEPFLEILRTTNRVDDESSRYRLIVRHL